MLDRPICTAAICADSLAIILDREIVRRSKVAADYTKLTLDHFKRYRHTPLVVPWMDARNLYWRQDPMRPSHVHGRFSPSTLGFADGREGKALFTWPLQ